MVITQRVTSLAYLLQDNLLKKEINCNNAKGDGPAAKVDKIPSPLEYFAYTLAFQTLMCGPVVFYSDYIKFIESARVDGVNIVTIFYYFFDITRKVYDSANVMTVVTNGRPKL